MPARLRQRQMAKEAAIRAQWLHHRARHSLEYRIKYKTYPADVKDLQERIPDPDGTLAGSRDLDPKRIPPQRRCCGGRRLKNRAHFVAPLFVMLRSSSATDDTPPGGLAFTNYVLRLPGEDKITGD